MSRTPPQPPHDAPTLATGFVLAGRWTVRPDINRIFDGGIEHQVPDKFMQVLVVLAARPGVVSRQELFEAVWPDTFVVDESLTRAISSLRRLLDDDPKRPRVIETIPKKGYRLLASVEPLAGGGQTAAAAVAAPAPRGFRVGTLTAIVAAVAVVVAAGWWLTGPRSDRRATETRKLQLTALPGIEEYPDLSPAGDRVAFVWDGDGAEPDGVFVQVIGAESPLRLTAVDGHYAFPTWTSDSRHVAFARVSGPSPGIFMVPATGGAEIELVAASSDEILISPAFSPDDRWLAFARRPRSGGPWQLVRTELETGRTETLAPSPSIDRGGYRPRFSPDGSRLAFLTSGGERREIVVAGADGSSPRRVVPEARTVADIGWAADGSSLVVATDDGIELVGLDGTVGRRLHRIDRIGVVSVAARAPVLAYSHGRRETNIWTWRRAPSDPARSAGSRIIHSTASDTMPVYSPDGSSIAFLSDRTGTTQLWIASRDGGRAHRLTELERVMPVAPAWSPDGRRLAIVTEADGRPAITLVERSGARVTTLPAPAGGESAPSWSGDGSALLVSRDAGSGSEVWRRPAAPEPPDAAVQLTHGGGVRAVEDPDGGGIFFTRVARSDEIWRCDPDGADPRPVFALDRGEILAWQAADHGLVVGFRERVDDTTYRIVHHDLRTGETTEWLEVPGRLGFDLDVDPTDPATIVFDRTEAVDSDIFAVEGI